MWCSSHTDMLHTIFPTQPALLLQALSLGLGEQWVKVKEAYAQANQALGDIIKVGLGIRENVRGYLCFAMCFYSCLDSGCMPRWQCVHHNRFYGTKCCC